MRRSALLAATTVAGAALIATVAEGDRKSRGGDYRPLGSDAKFTTVHTDALGLEGLTADHRGNLYSPGRVSGAPCPIRRVPASGGPAATVGHIPSPCSPTGLAFDRSGDLFVADGEEILRLRPSASNPPVATVFAGGVPGANGVAFDKRGDLWVSDGGTGQGRVWRIGDDGQPHEVFRVQPMVNDVTLDIPQPQPDPPLQIRGVGRDPRSAPPATVAITPTGRSASNTLGSQHLVANGLAFDRDGSLFIGDTARGAIWRVDLDRRGNVRSPTGCDTTFMPNTLCLDNVFVQHPTLEGVDGIALDRAGNVIAAVNERNAVVVATARDGVVELFRNPVAADQLRNDGPLEFPTSPVLVGRKLCLAHSDGNRRDNFPNSAGEVGPGRNLAKLSCLDRRLPVEGLPLPVR